MNTTTIKTGRTYLSGNTFNPTKHTVRAIISRDELTARETRGLKAICGLTGHGDIFVRFVGDRYPLPLSVVEATSYETLEAMIDAYAAKR